ncbi:hypothetical protein DXX93_14340 [Thalassotalea euphylliae]|uniref:Uncharacterized protein n=1 Tax=Thalassotalea euphylliae TaxID=1655234 RepID=A0A3E0TTE6_9GAMM|nr:protein-disulfide reductase DsbD domain-containing protein [Thalassotalea euphylliae]REL27617.1 hypothetical protein DXX93_14340 [Thalassotalea euphylliae]
MNRPITFLLCILFFIAPATLVSLPAKAFQLATQDLRLIIAKLPDSSTAKGPHIEVALLSEHNEITQKSGDGTQWLGILLSPDDNWHTYWRNAGDSGEAPQVRWQSSADIEFGDIQWPLPEQIPVAHLMNYGYSGDTLLMVPFVVKGELSRQQSITITADLSWLVCQEDCIPGWASLTIELPTSDNALPSAYAVLFEQTRARLPTTHWLSAQYEITQEHLTLAAEIPYPSNWQLLPFRSDLIQHSSAQQWLQTDNHDKANVLLKKSDYFSLGEEPIEFLLTDGAAGYYLTATFNDASGAVLAASAKGVNSTAQPFWLMLLFAFIGGLMLNIMPCVLPVLSLKAMALAVNKGDEPSTSKHHWGYLLGILVSFWLFAGVILGLKASGEAIGWGFHLQQPLVIAALCFLFVFIALMLLDVAPNGAGLAGFGEKLTQGNSVASQFFTGVLAVIVASPCTAPFMATALGVAMVSPALNTVLIFTALAIGFALPMLLLSFSARFASLIPKPGAWMETFKQFLAFPMLATVIWLLWVFLGQTNSVGQLWLLSGLLMFTLCLWLASKSVGKESHLAVLAAFVIAGYSSQQGSEYGADIASVQYQDGTGAQSLNIGHAFSEQKLAQLRNNNQVVVVNMTADWCITCKVNEQVAFRDEDLLALLQQQNVHYLVGDWTNKNSEILAFLTRYQRSGVPLYVVYAGAGKEQVLPQVLTPNIVISAIQQAQQELSYVSL